MLLNLWALATRRQILMSTKMERITGYAYYDAGTWFNNGQPGVRAELMREMLEV